VATALTVLISVGIGTLNGLLTVLGGIHSFVVTLGMNAIATGLAFVLTGAVSVPIQNTTFLDLFYWVAVFGIPVPLIAIVIAFIACFVALRRTAFGRELYAIGANMEAARLSAVPVKRDKILVFVIMGLLVGIGGILAAARLGSGSPPTNLALTLDAIAAVIIGGASLFGGRASLVRSVTGALLIGVLNNGMVLLNITTDAQFIIKGVIILFAVVLERVAAESSP
jgi:ribose/xylose/arabinose/galactoside ABC-type transport system permease subunit